MSTQGNEVFDALADPTRRTILRLLGAGGEMAAGEIVGEVDSVSRTGVSAHLRVLRTSGLISERKQGRFRLYSLELEAADEVVAFLAELYPSARARLQATTGKAAGAAKAPPRGRKGDSAKTL